MAQKFLSPGVETTEVDQSFITTAAPLPGAIVIGRTLKGPAFAPTLVSSFDEFQAVFGGTDPNYQVPYTAKNYLQNSTSLTVVRVLGHNDGTSASSGYTVGGIVGITDTSGTIGTTGSILAVIHHNTSFPNVQITGVAGDANNFIFRVGTTFAATASFLTSSDNYIGKVLNTDPTKYSTYGHYLYQTFPYKKQAASAAWLPVQCISSSFVDFVRNFDYGSTPWIKSQAIGSQEFDLFRIHTRAHGRSTNDDIKVQILNVKPPSAPDVYPYGTFDIQVRSFYDTDLRPVVLERFSQLNLDPSSPNYILKRIGDQLEQFDTTTRKFTIVQGTYPNNSNKIRVELNTSANFPPGSLPWGFRGFRYALFSGSNLGNGGGFGIANIPPLPYTQAQVDNNGVYNANISWGVTFVSGGVVDRMRAFPDTITTTQFSGSDADFSLRGLVEVPYNGKTIFVYNANSSSYAPLAASASMQMFTLPFQGGFDGWDLRITDETYLGNSTGDTDIGVSSLKRAIDTVANPDQIVGDLLLIPGIHNTRVADKARNLVNDRKDMFYVMDLTGSTVSEVVSNLAARSIDDNYTAAYYPDLFIDDQVANRLVRVSPSVGVAGAIAYNDRFAQAFFAPAGLTRGGLGRFNIVDAVDRVDHGDRDTLYDNRINPIAKFPQEGMVVFGQKTLQLRPSSLDRINVRRLLILAKRTVANIARNLIFEQNNAATWTRFVNKVNPILEGYRIQQGINRFKIVMDSTTNTPDIIDRNEMRGKIFLEPVRAAEYISIDFILTNAGVEFGS